MHKFHSSSIQCQQTGSSLQWGGSDTSCGSDGHKPLSFPRLCVVTLSHKENTQILHCNHSHCDKRRAVRVEGKRGKKEGKSLMLRTPLIVIQIQPQCKHSFLKHILAYHVVRFSGLTLAFHGGVFCREALPPLHNHHAACLGQSGYKSSEG